MRQVRWQADLDAAFVEALAQKKLLFVLFRCQRERRDTAILQPTDPKLIALLTEHYIPVRVISLKGLDLNRFRFDYDQQLMGLVLTPDGVTLARWGGDEASVASLITVLEQVRTVAWPKAASASAPQTLRQKFPAFAQSKRADEPCYHCHYVHDAEIEQQRKAGTFPKTLALSLPSRQCAGAHARRWQPHCIGEARLGRSESGPESGGAADDAQRPADLHRHRCCLCSGCSPRKSKPRAAQW